MSKFRMIGKDFNSSFPQYRAWEYSEPDFDGLYYTGLKSGDTHFINVSAYEISNDNAIVDFCLPKPTQWLSIKDKLPIRMADSQFAIVDGYGYLFGGLETDVILKCSLDNPTKWEDSGGRLPSILSGSHMLVTDDTLYLFGGNDGYTTNKAFSAPLADPLNWTDLGPTLPFPIQNSQLICYGGKVYLFGGQDNLELKDYIFSADLNDLQNWSYNNNLPIPICDSASFVIEGKVYILGGAISFDKATNNIYCADMSDLTSWNVPGYLPQASFGGQIISVGDYVYLYSDGNSRKAPYHTHILRCHKESPAIWVDMEKTLSGTFVKSQSAIIGDRIYVFGGYSTCQSICEQGVKFTEEDPKAVRYAEITRTEYQSLSNNESKQLLLCFPPWRTNYGS